LLQQVNHVPLNADMKLLAVVGLLSVSVWAQRFPDRWIAFDPLRDTTDRIPSDQIRWMHSSAGWGEFGGYILDRDAEHAWLQRLGALIELARIGEHTSIAFTTEIEFIANPDNNIRFNPRAVFWQEGLLVTVARGDHRWQLGYYHRCKHDVDNLSIGRERSLIYGSLLARYLVPFTHDQWVGVGVLRGDLFTIRQDDRTPPFDDGSMPNHTRLIGSLGASLHLQRPIVGSLLGLYTSSWLTVTGFRAATDATAIINRPRQATLQGGVAAGIAITGHAHFRIGVAWEYLADTGINPRPEHAHLVSLTISIVNPKALW
jgi:hypothetical protein